VIEFTGGYNSCLNGKVKRPNCTVSERVRCMLINYGRREEYWPYSAEHYVDIYCFTLHYDFCMTSDEAWYDTHSFYKDMHIWGCRLIFPAHDIKKSQESANEGFFYGYTKSDTLLYWFDDTTKNVKHAHGAQFLELNPLMRDATPVQQLLRLKSEYKEGDIDLPLVTIDLGDCAHFETEPFAIQILFTPVGTPLDL
jgi:hypothetical protein